MGGLLGDTGALMGESWVARSLDALCQSNSRNLIEQSLMAIFRNPDAARDWYVLNSELFPDLSFEQHQK